jgi:hypothetical protein
MRSTAVTVTLRGSDPSGVSCEVQVCRACARGVGGEGDGRVCGDAEDRARWAAGGDSRGVQDARFSVNL